MISNQLPSLEGRQPARPNPSLKRAWFRRAFILVPIAILLLSTGIAWLQAQRGGPTVSWSQAEILEFLVPNEDRTIIITFRSRQNLSNVAVEATPSLRSVLSVLPGGFTAVSANQDYQVTLRLGALVPAGTKLEGTLQLRDAAGPPNTYAQPLPITIVVHSEPVPPDPGEAGKQTIDGTDSDNDGIRDDVQRFIVLRFLTDQVEQRRALRYFARANQDLLVASSNAEIHEAARRRNQAQDCLNFLRGDPEWVLTIQRDLRAVLLNTRARSLAFAAADAELSGVFFPPPDRTSSSCAF